MAAGARTKCGERKKKHERFMKIKKAKIARQEAQIAAQEASIAATEKLKRIRWISMQDFRTRYSQFLLETRILTRRMSVALIVCLLNA